MLPFVNNFHVVIIVIDQPNNDGQEKYLHTHPNIVIPYRYMH